MKKQTTGFLEILFNSQNSFLEQFIGRTSESLKSFSNIEKLFLEKIIQNLPNMETRFACGGGAAN